VLLGIATFALLAGNVAVPPELMVVLVLANLISLLLLGAVLAGRLTGMWVERRRGAAGARLHVRLVLLFSGVALTPTIVIAVFSTGFFNLWR
jgi:two-component system, NtrC family, nitrogen regulation sensor histidine kinase NtrY